MVRSAIGIKQQHTLERGREAESENKRGREAKFSNGRKMINVREERGERREESRIKTLKKCLINKCLKLFFIIGDMIICKT